MRAVQCFSRPLDSAVQTWTYDAAGNRASASANPGAWVYDNLNRMSASPGTTYSHDVLGNRTYKIDASGTSAYKWDAVNRMEYFGPGPGGALTGSVYKYRADGMRTSKQNKAGLDASGQYVFSYLGNTVERSYYDGQMPAETDSTTSGAVSVTRNFVGARGVEAMFSTSGGVTNVAFPLYDTHGNMVATVARSGSGFSVGDVRTYDVWGGVRTGASSGGPKGRYVANLGHVQDDESGLIYMRARYYEPGTGRFISEDPARDGHPFAYAENKPTIKADKSGKSAILAGAGIGLIVGLIIGIIQAMVVASHGGSAQEIFAALLSNIIGGAVGGALGTFNIYIGAAAGSAVQSALNDLFAGRSVNWKSLILSVIVGIAGAGIAKVALNVGLRNFTLAQAFDEGSDEAVDLALEAAAGMLLGSAAGFLAE